jgi:hypothetical protein
MQWTFPVALKPVSGGALLLRYLSHAGVQSLSLGGGGGGTICSKKRAGICDFLPLLW